VVAVGACDGVSDTTHYERAQRFDGVGVDALASQWNVPQVIAFATIGSTMDVAATLARDGAPEGTVVIADAQTAGRGRAGHRWASPSGGAWCSMLIRPAQAQRDDAQRLGLVTLRVGLLLARALDELGAGDEAGVRIKWPNDLFVGGAKVGGILTEAQWEGDQLRSLVVGVGINRAVPRQPETAAPYPVAAVPASIPRLTLLSHIVRSVRGAATMTGPLSHAERDAFDRRDALRSHRLIAPAVGVASGVHDDGSLRIRADDGRELHVRSGRVRLVEE
jgi:BirA family transcriptional regulator, biotin operon repressor / biotin---[acetyl-CoA-carboxylase] ligase